MKLEECPESAAEQQKRLIKKTGILGDHLTDESLVNFTLWSYFHCLQLHSPRAWVWVSGVGIELHLSVPVWASQHEGTDSDIHASRWWNKQLDHVWIQTYLGSCVRCRPKLYNHNLRENACGHIHRKSLHQFVKGLHDTFVSNTLHISSLLQYSHFIVTVCLWIHGLPFPFFKVKLW